MGWKINRHEGKLTGLAAYGEPTLLPDMIRHYRISADGRIRMDFADHARDARMLSRAGTDRNPRERRRLGAGIARALHSSNRSAGCWKRIELRRLGLAGGVFANVRLNRLLAETLPVDEVFIVPPMGDDGLVIGGALQFLLERDGLPAWLAQRQRLTNVYWGGDHNGGVDQVFGASAAVARVEGDPAAIAADRLAQGQIGAIYNGRMEYGPRALGARSILANPADPAINQKLNQRLQRSEFMPFAPVVAEDDAGTVFDIGAVNRYAARFMTISCEVRREWQDRIRGRRPCRRQRPAADHPAGRQPAAISMSWRRSRRAPVCRCWSTPASTSMRSRSSTAPRNA